MRPTIEGLKYSRKMAEEYSLTAKTAEAREWWRRQAKELDGQIRAREKIERLNVKFKPLATILQGAFSIHRPNRGNISFPISI